MIDDYANEYRQDYCRVMVWSNEPIPDDEMKKLQYALGETLKQFPWANFGIEGSSSTAVKTTKPAMHWATAKDDQ